MSRRDKFNLEPLCIRAYLRCGVVCDRWLPLDGILLYQAVRQELGSQDVTIPGDYVGKPIMAVVPLGITHPGRRNWYYQCSWARWPRNVEGQDHWNKRFDSAFADLIDFGGQRGKVNNASGRYKAYHMPVFYRVAEWVEWYAVGDKAEIEQLLSVVTNVGKKTVQGWGRVIRWQIESIQDDWSVWRDGELMRGIPAEDVVGMDKPFNLGNYGIRPSYWKPNNQKLLAMPV